MQIKNVRKAGRVTVCAISAALLFSGMNLDVFAKEASGLPSAGIDYFLSSNATSVKNLKDEEEEAAPVASPDLETGEEKDEEEKESASPTQTAEATATPIATESPAASSVASAAAAALASPMKDLLPDKEEMVIEETVEASTDKTLNQLERELETKREEKSFRSLVIAKVNDYVNVRSMPSEEGEILGKLYDKSVGEFISEKDGWYEIESGSVTGYVKAEYCVTGDDAVELAKKVGTRIATVTTTTLKVREEPGLDAVVLGLIPIDDQLLVTEELDGWVKVNIEEGDGYISTDYVTLSTEFVKAESKAEEEARLAKEAAERKAAQEAAAKAARDREAKSKKSSSSAQEAPAPVCCRGRKRTWKVSGKLCMPVCG